MRVTDRGQRRAEPLPPAGAASPQGALAPSRARRGPALTEPRPGPTRGPTRRSGPGRAPLGSPAGAARPRAPRSRSRPPAARRPPTPALPRPRRPRPPPAQASAAAQAPPPRPAPLARRGPRKAGQRARSPQQEILAGLGAAEGAAAPGSGGSGIIFYQRRDQLPHPVTGPYTKAQTDLEKLGRPGGVGERRGAGMGPYRAAGPAAATRSRGAGSRRSSAPKSPTQKSPLRPAEGHGGGGRGGARPGRPAASASPAPRPEAERAARGGAGRGARHLPWGAGFILLHKNPRPEGLGGGIRPRCRQPRMRGGAGKRRGKRGLEGPPCSGRFPPAGGWARPWPRGEARCAGGEAGPRAGLAFLCRACGAAVPGAWLGALGTTGLGPLPALGPKGCLVCLTAPLSPQLGSPGLEPQSCPADISWCSETLESLAQPRRRMLKQQNAMLQ